MRSPPAGRGLTLDEKTLSNDRQVVDLHWVWKHGSANKTSTRIGKLLKEAEFDFAAVSSFVARRGKASDKADEIGLTSRKQLLLRVVQTSATRAKWGRIEEKTADLERHLNERADAAGSKLSPAAIHVRLNTYRALAIEEGEPTSAVRTYPMIAGEKISLGVVKKHKREFAHMGFKTDSA